MKSWQAALLCAALCSLLLAGCAKPPDTPANSTAASAAAADLQASMTLQLPCIEGEYNPYLTPHSITAQNAMLLFEPLTRIGPDMELDYRLAEQVVCTGNTVTITLRSGCTFADGSAVTAQDAAASLQAAKNSTAYGGRFAHVLEILVQDSRTVAVVLDSPDSLFAYLLDIPVLRMDEVGIRQPTAGGRYTYGTNGVTLVKNPAAPFADGGPEIIDLTWVSSHAELVSGLAMGSLDLYCSEETTTAGGISSGEVYYKTNRLLFLGVNAGAANPLCSTPEGRRLLSALTDRTSLAANCYDSRANVATGILNRFYACARNTQGLAATADAAALAETMTLLGYARDAQTGLYTNSRRAPATVRLLVYGGNSYKRYTAQVLQQMWAEHGISVVIEEAEGFEDYLTAVQRGEFELYIGEVKLYNNMDMSVFWTGEAHVGLAPGETLTAAYNAFKADAAGAAALEQAFAAEMPFIPLLWKNGAVTASRRITGLTPSLSDPFYSLQQLAPANR